MLAPPSPRFCPAPGTSLCPRACSVRRRGLPSSYTLPKSSHSFWSRAGMGLKMEPSEFFPKTSLVPVRTKNSVCLGPPGRHDSILVMRASTLSAQKWDWERQGAKTDGHTEASVQGPEAESGQDPNLCFPQTWVSSLSFGFVSKPCAINFLFSLSWVKLGFCPLQPCKL